MAHYIENSSAHGAYRVVVPPELAGMRLDLALARLLPQFSRSRLQEWIRSGHVKINDGAAVPKSKVWGGESLCVAPQEIPGTAPHKAEDISLSVVFEDQDILVIDKPAGLVVHPGSGNWSGTLLNALLQHEPRLEAVPRAGIVHRLDKDTSGLMVVAKTLESHTSLVRQLQARTVTREYRAVAYGILEGSGTVDAPVGRHPVNRTSMAVVTHGRPARTHYQALEKGTAWTYLNLRLDTGRTHQIRVHLHSIGHPLIGDPTYRPNRKFPGLPLAATQFHRQALHARHLALIHPMSYAELSWQAPMPLDMEALITALQDD
ncbi:MAG: 23S rRNA pseudouridine(1911/1915/1917) synthase RluD [Burkholderiales bacterium]